MMIALYLNKYVYDQYISILILSFAYPTKKQMDKWKQNHVKKHGLFRKGYLPFPYNGYYEGEKGFRWFNTSFWRFKFLNIIEFYQKKNQKENQQNDRIKELQNFVKSPFDILGFVKKNNYEEWLEFRSKMWVKMIQEERERWNNDMRQVDWQVQLIQRNSGLHPVGKILFLKYNRSFN